MFSRDNIPENNFKKSLYGIDHTTRTFQEHNVCEYKRILAGIHELSFRSLHKKSNRESVGIQKCGGSDRTWENRRKNRQISGSNKGRSNATLCVEYTNKIYLKYPLLSSDSARVLILAMRRSSYPRTSSSIRRENASPKQVSLLGSRVTILTGIASLALVAGDSRKNPYSKEYSTMYSSFDESSSSISSLTKNNNT